MITSSGAVCDVCGHYFLPLPDDLARHRIYEQVNFFNVIGVEQELCAHNRCRDLLRTIKRWEDLPDGPLKTAYDTV